jgi:hypothetical protein
MTAFILSIGISRGSSYPSGRGTSKHNSKDLYLNEFGSKFGTLKIILNAEFVICLVFTILIFDL